MAAIFPTGHAGPGSCVRATQAGAVPRWGWLALLAAVTVLWLVTMEASAVSQAVGGTSNFLHELFHDGRHLLGVPCH